jgi:hypothetical protein
MRKWLRILFRSFLVGVLFPIAIGGVVWLILNKERPHGVPGAEAERISNEMILAVNGSAWKETGVVRFTFLGHRHLWDRRRNFDRVEFGKNTVLLRIQKQTGRAWNNGTEVEGEKAKKLVRKAYEMWVNDSFWLNPVVKIFDRGVTRSIIRDEEGSHLLVNYASGGVTPGDAYLWTPGINGAPPTGWRIWAQQLPLGGLFTSWEDWITLSTGAKISTTHRIHFYKLKIEDVDGAKSLDELLNGVIDPFAPLNQ